MARVVSDLTISPLHPLLGARVEGVRLADPLDDPTFRRIFDAFQEHSVLVFHDQVLTDEQQMAFSRRFGPLEATLRSIGQERRLHENLVDLSNLDPQENDKLMDWSDRRMLYQSGNQLWHTDSSFKPVPAMASLLSGREVPSLGGETEFVSMRHAYATLPEERGGAWTRGWWSTASSIRGAPSPRGCSTPSTNGTCRRSARRSSGPTR
jgi:alpha-ketoglutarate-dependent 2,4-dichlorophenoxyacetate dioxygenase